MFTSSKRLVPRTNPRETSVSHFYKSKSALHFGRIYTYSFRYLSILALDLGHNF